MESILRHLGIVQFLEIEKNEKILKASRDYCWLLKKQWDNLYKVQIENNCQPGSLYSAKTFFENKYEIKILSEKQKFGELITSTLKNSLSTLKKILKIIFWAEENYLRWKPSNCRRNSNKKSKYMSKSKLILAL